MAVRVLDRSALVLACGGERAAREAVRSGRFSRVLHGVYADAAEPDLELRARAAALVLPPDAVVAGAGVLWLCGVDVLPAGPPVLDVLVPRGHVVPRRRGLRAREGLLTPDDVGTVRGVPALRPVRAAVDLMRLRPLHEGVVVADAVQHAGLLGHAGLTVELRRHARLRGVRRAREALELSDPRAESPQESRVRVLLQLAGLRAVPQYDVHDARGRWLARVDLAFPDARVAVEYDGFAVHTGSGAFARDRQRQNALLAAGWTVLRFSAVDLRDRRDAVVAEVRAALLRAA